MSTFNQLISTCWGFARYCLTGCTSLATFVGTSNALYFLKIHPTISTFLGWVASALVAYFGHIHFSYRVQANHKKMGIRYIALLGINFIQISSMTYILYELLGVDYSLTSLIVGLSVSLVSYPLGKFWAFKEKAPSCS